MIPKDVFGKLPASISNKISVQQVRHHSKASETYADVTFSPDGRRSQQISIPLNYRRTGLDPQNREDCIAIIMAAVEAFTPSQIKRWEKEADEFWDSCNREKTRPFFDALRADLGQWVCLCSLPANPNWARRTQDIKECGYTLATDTSRRCERCRGTHTHLMLLPVPRGLATGYETWSLGMRQRILRVLGNRDVYEGAVRPPSGLLPDHKFPEVRWDATTASENPDTMTDSEIRSKFQLITNQRNQQKREVCRNCFQTGDRGSPFGISFYYTGTSRWPTGVPRTGPKAESGCVGCGWYDLDAWRAALQLRIR